MSYVLLGICELNGDYYAVRSIISEEDNTLNTVSLFKLGAVKGKKIDNPNPTLKRGAAVTGQSPLISSGYRTISIADFLQNVKDIPLINEVLSKDVAKKLGVTRSVGTLSLNLRFSMDAELNKNNRVIAAQFASIEAIANTPRSPRFNNSIPQNSNLSTDSSTKSENSARRNSIEPTATESEAKAEVQ